MTATDTDLDTSVDAAAWDTLAPPCDVTETECDHPHADAATRDCPRSATWVARAPKMPPTMVCDEHHDEAAARGMVEGHRYWPPNVIVWTRL